jgi:hypothetical protein
LAYSGVFDEDTHIVSGIDAIGLGFNRGSYCAHGDEEEKSCCDDLHGEGFEVMALGKSI